VRLAVHEEIKGRQTPWEIMALTKQFAFFPGADGEVDEDLEPEPEKTEEGWRRDLESLPPDKAYVVVVRQNNVIVYQVFVAIFPDTRLSRQIAKLLDRRLEMLAWFDAVRLNSDVAYLAFLTRYPDSGSLSQTCAPYWPSGAALAGARL
jgi:hypothetical protein